MDLPAGTKFKDKPFPEIWKKRIKKSHFRKRIHKNKKFLYNFGQDLGNKKIINE